MHWIITRSRCLTPTCPATHPDTCPAFYTQNSGKPRVQLYFQQFRELFDTTYIYTESVFSYRKVTPHIKSSAIHYHYQLAPFLWSTRWSQRFQSAAWRTRLTITQASVLAASEHKSCPFSQIGGWKRGSEGHHKDTTVTYPVVQTPP